ncbi:MAG: CZB domain-containing protein [Planctomycetota bacterium]
MAVETNEALDRAVAIHAKWKYRLMDAIESGKSEWRVADVRVDDSCEFGKWLGALPLSDRLSPHAQKVKALHTDFHRTAADVLEMALAGRRAEATAAMALGSRFAEVSSNLTMAVAAWKEAASSGS